MENKITTLLMLKYYITQEKRHTGIPGLWTQEMDAGLWMLHSGRWTLDAGRWTLDSESWTLDSGHRTLNPGQWAPDAER